MPHGKWVASQHGHRQSPRLVGGCGWHWKVVRQADATSREAPNQPTNQPTNQFQFQLQLQLQQFLCSLQPVYCDTYLYCLLYLPPLPPSLSCLSLCLSGLTEINLILYAVTRLANEPQLQSSDLHTDWIQNFILTPIYGEHNSVCTAHCACARICVCVCVWVGYLVGSSLWPLAQIMKHSACATRLRLYQFSVERHKEALNVIFRNLFNRIVNS